MCLGVRPLRGVWRGVQAGQTRTLRESAEATALDRAPHAGKALGPEGPCVADASAALGPGALLLRYRGGCTGVGCCGCGAAGAWETPRTAARHKDTPEGDRESAGLGT